MRKQATQPKSGQKIWTDSSLEDRNRWQISTWKKCLPLLVIREKQIKTVIRHHYTPIIMTLIYYWWECKKVQPLWKKVWQWVKNYSPREMKAHDLAKNCTCIFKVALFVKAKIWNQLKSVPTDEWVNELWYNHAMEYHSAIKSNEPLIYTTMGLNLKTVMHNRRRTKNVHTYCTIPFL